ncbi:hypothetical protein [Flavobacterium piscis]|uniref:TonB-dependent receptor n=1 Tax=Flavobacterium piscis TaxID=1114874 RepID=A0ABU1Y299_9FLAO|nr:hypothetical protein [Flavobacterium piscis]MDR7208343.1 hypothetical protein [Flavobacterium piscis]
MYKYLILLLSTLSFGQTINLNIINKEGSLINNCNVLFKEKKNDFINEFIKIYNGKSSYTLTYTYDELKIEVQSFGYSSETILVNNPKKNNVYSFDVKLIVKVNELKEIILVGKQTPFKIKNDTIVFNVNEYKDDSDKKVEDLLKKLPGIEVDGNGSIKYKGKQLETVTLDGNNIFNNNYKLGTKNINIDMIDQIEAIDNYTNNSLLKGIESEGKVALNLKLKKGKTDFSGNFENAFGLKNDLNPAFYSNSYVMQISSRVKSFGLLNINNIGRSDTYFYEKQNNNSLDRISDDYFRTKRLFSDDLYSPQIDPIRYNINNQIYLSNNNLFKINKRLTLKSNLNFIIDKIYSNQNINTINFIDTTLVKTNDNFTSIKKPNVFSGDFELKYNTTNNTLIEVFSKQYFEKTSVFSNYLKNEQIGFQNFNETKSFFSINKLAHTWKISSDKALQANLYYSYNTIPQTFESINTLENINQDSKFKKSTLLLNYNLIGKNKDYSYALQIGSGFQKNPYFSENSIDINDTSFKKNYYFSHSRINIFLKKITIIPNISLTHYNLSLENRIPINKSYSKSFIFEPSLNIILNNKNSTFLISYSNTQKPVSEEYIFTNNVFTNNRIIINNQPTLDYKKTNNFLFNYFYNNLYTNTTVNFSSLFQKNNGQYLSKFSITENYSIIKNSFYNEENSSFNTSFRLSKFIEKLALNLTYSSSLIYNKYPNFLNNSDIRKNNNQVFTNTFIIRTGFNSKINFENSMSYKILESKSTITNINSSIDNNFKIRCKINKKYKASIKWNVFMPDFNDKSNAYNFVDFELNYKLNDKINFILVGNNLLNLKYFNQVENNDFSSYVSTTNLTQQFFLLNMEYTF